MNTDNKMMLDNDSVSETETKNKGFSILAEAFKSKGWHLNKNEVDWVVFSHTGNELDSFEIRVYAKNIQVTVPLKNSRYQYVTSFNNYFEACEYMENRLIDFVQ